MVTDPELLKFESVRTRTEPAPFNGYRTELEPEP